MGDDDDDDELLLLVGEEDDSGGDWNGTNDKDDDGIMFFCSIFPRRVTQLKNEKVLPGRVVDRSIYTNMKNIQRLRTGRDELSYQRRRSII
jgi:hypothetical protein